MEIVGYLAIFIGSLAVLVKGSNWFVDSAESIGLSMGIPPFIVGVTIVAFGTSLPELAASIASIYAGKSEIVIGNVIGSNITNIALVLGITAFYVKSIKLHPGIWNTDLPLLVGSGFLLWFTIQDQNFTYFEAILFLLGLVIFLAYTFSQKSEEEVVKVRVNWRKYFFLILGGGLVYFGATYTIYAITNLSTIAGIDPTVIALTAVALGTSLPEIVVSLDCVRRGKTDIAVGNVLGSNIFNTFAVMGVPALFGKLEIPAEILEFSLPLMLVMTILFGIMCISNKITRWEGLILLMFYAFFLVELFKG